VFRVFVAKLLGNSLSAAILIVGIIPEEPSVAVLGNESGLTTETAFAWQLDRRHDRVLLVG
jgi:hypothetical protein